MSLNGGLRLHIEKDKEMEVDQRLIEDLAELSYWIHLLNDRGIEDVYDYEVVFDKAQDVVVHPVVQKLIEGREFNPEDGW